MRKNWLYLVFCLFICTSCENSSSETERFEDISNHVSIDEALQSLNCILDLMAEGGNTRSRMYQVQSVQSVKLSDVYEPTRSGNLPDVDNLFYIVSFGEGQGSAVLGADRRVERVFAILDETQLTLDDFKSDSTRTGSSQECEEVNFITDLIINTAIGQSIIGQKPIVAVEESRTILESKQQSPLLKMKWRQGFPYNEKMPYITKDGKTVHASTGCVPLVCAEFLTHMHWPQQNSISGERFDWTLIDQCVYGNTPSPEALDEVARYIYRIATELEVEYWAEGTGASFEKACNVLGNITGHTFSLVDFDLDKLEEIICEKGPVCVRGGLTNEERMGHGWVVDGWNSCLSEIEYGLYRNGVKIDKTKVEVWSKLIHCCWGFAGKCDGYYSGELLVFDLTEKLASEFVDESVGDVEFSFSNEKAIIDHNFKMITY